MGASRLIRRRWLDPREAGEAAAQPVADAVNIPFSELLDRLHELPPRADEVGVVGPAPLADEVVAWLLAVGRRARRVDDWSPAPAAPGSELGRLWEPTAFLAEMLPRLTTGTALDLACGTGRDAIYLASCGWDVTAVDVLPDALERAQRLAARYAPVLEPIRWEQMDLEQAPPQFDRRFDLIIVFRYLNRPLLGRLHAWLRPGGSVLCETFTTLHRRRHGKPVREAHVLLPGELPGLLAGLEIRHFSEAWRGRLHTARAWAVRAGSSGGSDGYVRCSPC